MAQTFKSILVFVSYIIIKYPKNLFCILLRSDVGMKFPEGQKVEYVLLYVEKNIILSRFCKIFWLRTTLRISQQIFKMFFISNQPTM